MWDSGHAMALVAWLATIRVLVAIRHAATIAEPLDPTAAVLVIAHPTTVQSAVVPATKPSIQTASLHTAAVKMKGPLAMEFATTFPTTANSTTGQYKFILVYQQHLIPD